MDTFIHLSTPRTYRRVSAAAIANYASTDAQAARLAAFCEPRFEPSGAPSPLWDDGLLDRLTQPMSRIRE